MRARRAESGETLVELLVTTAILGLAIVGILGALGTMAITSDASARGGSAQAVLRSNAEALKMATFDADCPPDYDNFLSVPTGYSVEVVATDFGTVSSGQVAFGAACSGTTLQRLTVEIESSDSRVGRSIQIVKRP